MPRKKKTSADGCGGGLSFCALVLSKIPVVTTRCESQGRFEQAQRDKKISIGKRFALSRALKHTRRKRRTNKRNEINLQAELTTWPRISTQLRHKVPPRSHQPICGHWLYIHTAVRCCLECCAFAVRKAR